MARIPEGPPPDHFPTCSWWVGLDGELFIIRRLAEQPRMMVSRYGRIERLVKGGSVESLSIKVYRARLTDEGDEA